MGKRRKNGTISYWEIVLFFHKNNLSSNRIAPKN